MRKVKALITALFCAVANVSLGVSAFAEGGGFRPSSGGIGGSTAVTGTQNLVNDLTSALLIIAPIVGGACIIYFCIRRSAADEMDQKKWNNRIVTAIVSTIGAVLAAGLLNVIVGYYQ